MEPAQHVITAGDGWHLDVADLAVDAPKAIVIAGHAMMVDRRTLYSQRRRSLAPTLAEMGFRVLVPELRGRGASGPTPAEGGRWEYEDFVADVPLYVELAQRLAPGVPVVLIGHSLFGHTSLAYLGQHPDAPVAAVVALAVSIWGKRFEPSRGRWLKKRAIMAAATTLTRMFGYFPARKIRMGTADEAEGYWNHMNDCVVRDRWRSLRDGTDYHAGLARVRCPVLHVVSDGDVLFGEPTAALAFSAPLGDRREILRVGPDCHIESLRGLTPDHIPLVTRPVNEPIWRAVGEWIAKTVS